MPKNVKPRTTAATRKRATAKSRPTSQPATQPAKPGTQPARTRRPGTKQEQVLRMLQSKSGATVPAIMKATGWLEHTVRGFFSAVVRKRLGLELVSEGEGAKRRYRIASEAPKGTKARRS
jgi:hypothetical protein